MATVLTDIKGERFVDTVLRTDGRNALCVDMRADVQIGAVEIKDRDSDDRCDVVLRDDGKYALAVDMQSDIEIGAVEIKDAITDNRATVIQQGSVGALVVSQLDDVLKATVNIYGDASVSYDSTVTLASYTVPTGKTFKFSGVIVGGNADGEFYVEVGGTRIALIRNSISARTIMAKFWNDITVNSGGVVEVKVKNISWVKKSTKQFEATINGYTVVSA